MLRGLLCGLPAMMICVLGLVAPSAAQTIPPALSQAPGETACVMPEEGKSNPPCRVVPGLWKPSAAVIDRSGRDLYVAAPGANRVIRLRAEGSSGLVYGDCIASSSPRCRRGGALNGVADLALSRDGRWLFALAPGSGALTLLERDRRTGTLRFRSCLTTSRTSARRSERCRVTPSLAGATALGISADGATAYVALGDRDAVVGIRRDGSSLEVLRGPGGCVAAASAARRVGLANCRRANGLGGAVSVDVAPDGRNVYVAGKDDDAVAILTRSRSGRLQPQGCVGKSSRGRCRGASALDGPVDVGVSPDDANVYAVAVNDRTVTAFSRGTNGALDQIGCYGSGLYVARFCSPVPQLIAPNAIAVTRAGDAAFLADPASSSVSAFVRAFGGDLAPVAPPEGCIDAFGSCVAGRGLVGVSSVAIAPNSRIVYAVSPIEQTVAVLLRPGS